MSPQLLREANPTARKAHYCSLCTSQINVGDTYSRRTLVNDGQVYDWLECYACHTDKIVNLVADWAYGEDGISPEAAYEWATETASHPGSQTDTAKRYLDRTIRKEQSHE